MKTNKNENIKKNTKKLTAAKIEKNYFDATNSKRIPSMDYLKNSRAASYNRFSAQLNYIKENAENSQVTAAEKRYLKQQYNQHLTVENIKFSKQGELAEKYIHAVKNGCPKNQAGWIKSCYIPNEKVKEKLLNNPNHWHVGKMKNFSDVKLKMEEDCQKLCKMLGGKQYTISNVDSHGFECAFLLPKNVTVEKLRKAGCIIAKDFKLPKKPLFYLQQKKTSIIDATAKKPNSKKQGGDNDGN